MKKFRYLDWWILAPYLILVAIGVVMVYSASSGILLANKLPANAYFKKQLGFALIGLFLAFFTYLLRVQLFYYRKVVLLILGVSLVFMISLLFLKILRPSAAVNGAVGWINIFGVTIQPVEISKFALIIYLAFIFGRKETDLHYHAYLKTITAPVLLAMFFMLLAALQPDMGGAGILLLITMVMVAASGIPWIFSAGIFAVLGSFLTFGIYFLGHLDTNSPILKTLKISGYQLARIQDLFHPFQVAQHGGQQLVNSYYAINNGGWFGRGLGRSIQKMGYLPEPYTDFILSITAEELGVIGVAIIIILLGILIIRSIYLGIRVRRNTYLALICYGIGTMMFIQVLFNIGGVLGVLPITGVTLPFISYGGSSMLILSVCMGLLMNISAYDKRQQQRLQEIKKEA